MKMAQLVVEIFIEAFSFNNFQLKGKYNIKKLSLDNLGALGRRFKTCRPDHLKTKSY